MPEHDTTQPFSTKQLSITETAALASPTKLKQNVEVAPREVFELSKHSTAQTFPIKLISCSQRTKEEKGKDKVRDEVPSILVATGLSSISEVTEESGDSPLSGVVACRTESETTGIYLEERIEAGLTGSDN